MRNQTNSGSPFHQWNKGAREAAGEYLWFAEADDFCDARFLETLVEKLDASPDAGIAFCESNVVDEQDNANGLASAWAHTREGERWKTDFSMKGIEACRELMIWRNVIPNASAVLLRRSTFEQVGGADDTMRVAGDWLLWSNMLLVSDLVFVAQPLNSYRFHQQSASHHSKNLLRIIEERYRVLHFLTTHLSLPKPTLESVRTSLCDHWVLAMLNHPRAFTLRQNRAIYRAAGAMDSRLIPRLLKTFVSLKLRRNKVGQSLLKIAQKAKGQSVPDTSTPRHA